MRTQMRSAANYNAHREAIAAGERRLTFAEAWQRGVRLANGLLALGLRAISICWRIPVAVPSWWPRNTPPRSRRSATSCPTSPTSWCATRATRPGWRASRRSIPIRRSIRRTTSSSVTPAAPRARRRVSPIRITPGSPPAATGSTSIRRSSRAIHASISRRSVAARVISSRRSGSTAAAMSCPRSSIRRPCPISNACWWRPRRSPTIRPSRPARSSETPCIRAMARPRYYLLR